MGLRNWRLTSQSSPDISVAENKQSWPLLQTNVLTTFRSLRSQKDRDQDIKQWRRTTMSLFSTSDGNKPQKTDTKPASSPDGPSMSWTLTDPQTHRCSPLSGFTSITISTRKISSPLKHPGQTPSNSSVSSTVKNDKVCGNSPMLFSCRATMVKVTEYRERYEANQKNTSSLSGSKQPIFSSSVHLEILSCRSPSSTFYLYKLLSIPVCAPQNNRRSLHRATLFLSATKLHLSSSLKRPQEATRHLFKPCEQNIIDCNGTVEKTHHLGMAIVKSRTSRGDPSSDSRVQLANVTPLPFRARCHSSSEAVRVNEKANDVSGTLRSNQRGHVEGPVKSGVSVRSSFLGRVPRSHTEMGPRPQECVVSSRLLTSCTCGSNSTDQLQLLSLKEALQLFRPDFILRSQRRVHEVEQRARERQGLQPADSTMMLQSTNRRQICTKPHPLSDNLFKPKDRVISGKEMQLHSKRIYNKLPEVTRKKEEERRKLVLQTNRLRAEVFKKKLLDQILQRNSD